MLDRQGSTLRPGDVALVRTGYLSGWPDADFIAAHEQAGIDRDAALLLAESGVVAVGGDTESLEVLPSTVPGNPHPVHIALLVERGIFILEMVNCRGARARRRARVLLRLPAAEHQGRHGIDGRAGRPLLDGAF